MSTPGVETISRVADSDTIFDDENARRAARAARHRAHRELGLRPVLDVGEDDDVHPGFEEQLRVLARLLAAFPDRGRRVAMGRDPSDAMKSRIPSTSKGPVSMS